jgi:twitching motility protein PilJ
MELTNNRKDTVTGLEPVPSKRGAVKTKTIDANKLASGGLASLKVGQKLSLIALAVAIPVVVLSFILITEQSKVIDFSAKELRGTEYLRPVAAMLGHVAEESGASAAYITRQGVTLEQLKENFKHLDTAMAEIEAVDQRFGAEFKTTKRVADFKTALNAIKTSVLNPSGTTEQNAEAWDKLVENHLVPLVLETANTSNLILDPDLDTYYVMDVLVNKLPELADELSDIQDRSAKSLTSFNTAARAKIAGDVDLAKALVTDSLRSLSFAAQTSPEQVAGLQATARKLEANLITLTETVQNQVINPNKPSANVGAIVDQAAKVVTEVEQLNTAGFEVLSSRLQARINAQSQARLFSLLAVLVVSALAAGLVFWISRLITDSVKGLASAAKRVSDGDFSTNILLQSKDELGQLAATFNETMAQLKAKSESDREQLEASKELQSNIGEFLNVTMDIAQGDMTKRGKVSDDVLGNVVDAINLMAEELGYVLKDVQGVATTVNNGANSMSVSSDSVLEGAAQQAREAATATTDTQNMAQSIRKMAQRATESATAATQTLTASQQGTEAVNNTLQGMQAIRREVSHISKGIKGLSDRSLEISEIVEAITSIASQTNLLALNAAIEASGAGEAGSRFAIVADEVRRLADDSAKAAARVGGLIKNVQTEIQELVSSVEGGTKEVEQGYRIATQAGERLREISDLANQSNALAQAISGATGQQVQGVERVAQAVSSIAATAQKTQEESSKGRETAEQLRNLSAQLSGTLDRFRLPA